MAKPLTVLVTGATGQQGGAVARELLERGHHVRAFTRKPTSAAAEKLKGRGAEVVQGDFEDGASIERAARGADAAFIMSTPFEAGMEAETRQGINAVDAARRAGVKHIVYTSVASADQKTGIPHFDSKYRVEQHLAELAVPYTIVAPVFFMENLLSPWWLPGLQAGSFAMAIPPERKLQQIAVENIGRFDAMVIELREPFLGQRIDIASDELSGSDMARILTQAAGRQIEYVQQPLEQVRSWSEDFATMYEWFDRVGYSAAIPKLRQEYPEVGWKGFRDWTKAQDWSVLRVASAG